MNLTNQYFVVKPLQDLEWSIVHVRHTFLRQYIGKVMCQNFPLPKYYSIQYSRYENLIRYRTSRIIGDLLN